MLLGSLAFTVADPDGQIFSDALSGDDASEAANLAALLLGRAACFEGVELIEGRSQRGDK